VYYTWVVPIWPGGAVHEAYRLSYEATSAAHVNACGTRAIQESIGTYALFK